MAAAAVQRLVKDRFPDFQRVALSKCTLTPVGAGATTSAPLRRSASGHFFQSPSTPADAAKEAPVAKGSFMREFFDSVSVIQSTLNEGRGNVKLMGEVLEEALQVTTQERQRVVSERLQALVQETNGHLANVKDGLQRLKSRSDEEEKQRPNSAEGKIRANMQQAMAKKHQQLLLDFQKAQVDFKQALERRQLREMEILMPEASPEERAEMIEAGETTQLVVAKKMAGAHAMLLDEVQRIREKHEDILRLERSIADLAQMFTEVATLVEAQGEMLDAIEVHVEKAKTCTAKAEQALITTRKKQRNTQKWMCCLSIFLMVVMLCILGPVLIK
uniref:t-SNARE coiled-coil homology domain-containing protein n=1 Tax=Alexandrium andersonii TaxID=327968 RepID=A0A7S2FK72_9DINO|mmetsp:Transcript_27081/g.61704  ORF Transcript_27081/g.61704 Transcript_27081/m.61704 type:complete len:331 (+) Transcript_27081:121-1113(+)